MKKKFYLIYSNKGLKMLDNWDDCKKLTKGIKGVLYKSFEDCESEEMIRWFISKIVKEPIDIKEKLEVELKNLFELSNVDLQEYYSEMDNLIEMNDIEDLKQYLDELSKTTTIAFVDGSYKEDTNEYSYGLCVVNHDKVIYEDSKKFLDTNGQRQINGELQAAILAIKYAIDNNFETIHIAYDYIGIKDFPVSDWKCKYQETQTYKDQMKEYMKKINIVFIKIPAHTNFKFNEYADELAKKVLGIKK